jgi:thiol:disulfide interchange protein
MATYKKGFKKQNPQLTLLKTILAIIVTVVVLVMVAFIYDKATDWRDYNSYDHLETYDQVLEQDQEDYVVYFYSETCEACQSMKEDILGVLNDVDKDMNNIYLVDVTKITNEVVGEDEEAYTRDDLLEDLDIESITTPSFVVVANGALEEVITGIVNIEDFLDDLDSNTYNPFIN